VEVAVGAGPQAADEGGHRRDAGIAGNRQEGGSWVIRDEIRRMVTFFHNNLVRDDPTLPQVDVLLLRNVLIYFDVETKRAILERVRRHLRPGGLLMLGTAETTLNLDERFERLRIGRAVFYRAAGEERR
jgi:chemotaxis protein methyltransferase CheR